MSDSDDLDRQRNKPSSSKISRDAGASIGPLSTPIVYAFDPNHLDSGIFAIRTRSPAPAPHARKRLDGYVPRITSLGLIMFAISMLYVMVSKPIEEGREIFHHYLIPCGIIILLSFLFTHRNRR